MRTLLSTSICRAHPTALQRHIAYRVISLTVLCIRIGHAKTLLDMPDEYLTDIGPVLKKVATLTGAEHYNILQNNGKMASQVCTPLSP